VLPGQIPLLYFHRKLLNPNDPEVLRDLGIAMINMARLESRDEIRGEICGRALPFLDMAVHNDPDDIDAQEAQGFGFWVRGNPRQALAVLEKALAKVPQREVCLEDAARVAAQLGQDQTAIEHWRRLLSANPWNAAGHYLLAKLLAERNDWLSAMEEARWSVRLEPNEVPPRVLLVAGYLHDGKKEDARREFELIERLQPPQLDKLRSWFAQQSR
jgi:tetratricopeptide (TPR) repeat protein